MPQKIVQVDAFADQPFAGNPAAVCVLDSAADPAWMQAVALEMNLSETAFLVREGDHYQLRWFTPTVEVDLCGHATLASAHVLWEEGYLVEDAVAQFETRSGRLLASKAESWITLDFPANPVSDPLDPAPVAQALGVGVTSAWRSRFDILAEVESEAVVRSIQPDFGAITALPARGLIATSRASTIGFDFVSRFFAPGSGVLEDPVTGSAHTVLGPYWGEKLSRSSLVGAQVSSRGGVVRVELAGNRVRLGGQAVTVFRGELVHANRWAGN